MGAIESLVRMKSLRGTIRCLSGLHIGTGRDNAEIGGMDLPVIRNPVTSEPIIPGSSLKGKLRSLLEWHFGKLEPDGRPWGWGGAGPYDQGDPILCIFGTTAKGWQGGPTRLLVRDAWLDPAWVAQVTARGLPLTEEKTEVVIDRIKGKALDGVGPHTSERVPAGAGFFFEMNYRVFSVDGDGGAGDEARFETVLLGMRLLELDALGGSGSRGYGRVAFESLSLDGEDLQARFAAHDPTVSGVRAA
ncbi:MAG: type III-A CRISPR-associated RAMP protein Csm3 [Thermodesulfobacteriota bacterium]